MEPTKEDLVGPYLARLEARINFIDKIYSSDERYTYNNIELLLNLEDIALLLCVCYIEGLGRFYDNKRKSMNNFINALVKWSGIEIFCAILPKILKEFLENKSQNNKNEKENCKKIRELYDKLKEPLSTLAARNKFFDEDEMIAELNTLCPLSDEEKSLLKDNLKYGSYAAYAYKLIRCNAVHEIDPAIRVFDGAIFRGNGVEDMDFPILIRALKNIFAEIKKLPIEEHYKILFA